MRFSLPWMDLWLWYWCPLHANWMKNTKVCSLLFKAMSWIGSEIPRFAFIKIARSSAQWFNGLIQGKDDIICWTTRKKKSSAKPTYYHYGHDHSSAILTYRYPRYFPSPSEKLITKINLIILSFEPIANNRLLTLLSRQYNEPKW